MSEILRNHIWKTSLSLRYPGLNRLLSEMERSQWWKREQVAELQHVKLLRLVDHAYRTVPFFRKRWDAIGFTPVDLTSETFKRLPLLSKRDIKQNLNMLVCPDLQPRARLNSTGGSTGEPVQFYQDKNFSDIFYAAAIRHNCWSGWRSGLPVIRIWGNPADIKSGFLRNIHRRLLGEFSVNSFQLDDKAFERACQILTKEKPSLLIGYASAVDAFAEYLRKTGRTLKHRLRGIITSAELLTEDMRNRIEETFGVRVYDRYGCRETGLIASQCEAGSYHVNDENILVETVAIDNGVEEFVITDLNNLVMPFIRYRIGDIGRLSLESCPCGRGLSCLEMVGGRTTDLLLTGEGDVISGPSLTLVFKDVKEVRQVQLYQPERGVLIVRMVRDDGYNQDIERLLMDRLRRYFGEQIRIDFSYTAAIQREASGKYRFAISDIFRSQS